jgi:hypothetical protein
MALDKRSGLKKAAKKQRQSRIEYLNLKSKNSIKYASVECYKKIKGEFSLEMTILMVVNNYNLNKLKYDLIKVNVLKEWSRN